MCFVCISEQAAIISLYNINWLVSITETECVYCAVRTGSLNLYTQFTLILFLKWLMYADASNARKCGSRGGVLGEREYPPTLKNWKGRFILQCLKFSAQNQIKRIGQSAFANTFLQVPIKCLFLEGRRIIVYLEDGGSTPKDRSLDAHKRDDHTRK